MEVFEDIKRYKTFMTKAFESFESRFSNLKALKENFKKPCFHNFRRNEN